MVICRYYGTPGGCRYGKNCKYEHVDPPGAGGGNSDPFSSSANSAKGSSRYSSSRIQEEIQWPLTAIANRDSPEQGNVLDGDISPEELRVQAYQMVSRGMSSEVQQRETQLVAEHNAKIDGISRGGMETAPSTTNNAFQVRDPFAQGGGGTSSQQNQRMPFGGGFGGSNGTQQSTFSQPPSSTFSQPPQPMAPNPSPFSAPSAPQGNMLPPNQGFSQQPTAPVHNSAPVANASHDAQFSAAQFGFAKIPEAAPPPKYY